MRRTCRRARIGHRLSSLPTPPDSGPGCLGVGDGEDDGTDGNCEALQARGWTSTVVKLKQILNAQTLCAA